MTHRQTTQTIDEHRRDFTPTFWTGAVPPNVSIEQVWFAGAHADIGGGYKTRSLADIPLVWMVKQAEAAGRPAGWECLPHAPNRRAPRHAPGAGWRPVCLQRL